MIPYPPELVEQIASKAAPVDLPWVALDTFIATADALPDPKWLISELVPDSGPTLMAAAPNAGKTFFTMVIGKAAARAKRPVYLVLEEGGAKKTGERFKSLRMQGLPTVRVLHQQGVSLATHVPALVTMLEAGREGPPPVLVLDPFSSVFRGNENDTEQMSAAVALLRTLGRADPRALLVIPHHTSKAGERGDVGEASYASRGGTSLPAWADVVLVLKHVKTPKGSGLVQFDALMAKNRDGERDYAIRVTIELGTGEVTMAPAAEAKREAKAQTLAPAVLAEIGRGAASGTTLAERLHRQKADVLQVCAELQRDGSIVKIGHRWQLSVPGSEPVPNRSGEIGTGSPPVRVGTDSGTDFDFQ